MQSFDIGDPGSPNAGYSQDTPITLPGSTARLLALNDSPYQILLQFVGLNGQWLKVPSGWARVFPVAANAQQVSWKIDQSLDPTSAVISDLTLECYMPGEDLPNQWPIMRQMGGQVKAVSATQVQNDGMPSGTSFVEATSQVPVGISPFGSNVILYNDGRFYFVGISNGAAENFLQAVLSAGIVTIVLGGQDVPITLGAGSGHTNGDVTIGAGARLFGAGGAFEVDTAGNITGGAANLDGGALVSSGTGLFSTYGVHATAGQGLAAIRASLEPPASVAVTTLQTVLTYTPPVSGLYLAVMRFRVNNGTSGQLVKAQVTYQDADTGSAPAIPFQGVSSARSYLVAAGSVSFANAVYDCQGLLFRAAGGQAISLQYQDPGGTPNDLVSGAIIQLA